MWLKGGWSVPSATVLLVVSYRPEVILVSAQSSALYHILTVPCQVYIYIINHAPYVHVKQRVCRLNLYVEVLLLQFDCFM